MILRDYQQQGIQDIRQAYRDGHHRPLYVLPTGGGKTVMFTYIARNAAARQKRVCIIVHRRELLLQTIRALDHEHGVISPGFSPSKANIQIATIQTLVRRLDRYDFDLLVIDEAHHIKARTWLKAIEVYPNARILGVTATPCRLDGQGLGDVFDHMIVGPTVTELTEQGYLAPCRVYAPATIDVSGVHTRMGDFVRSEVEAAADTPTITGCAIEHYKKYCDGVPAIAFCVSVQHAEHVAQQFREAGYRATSVDGNTKQVRRDWAIHALGNGDLDILTSCEIISEGVDIPVVGCGILLRPTQSTGMSMQQMGRILRPQPGKTAIILDHAGNWERHGLPSDPRDWTLEMTKRRNGTSGISSTSLRRCPQCFAVTDPAPKCRECGYIFPIKPREVEQVDGELEEITATKAKEKREVGMTRDRPGLEAIAKARGYKPGWVNFVISARARKARARA